MAKTVDQYILAHADRQTALVALREILLKSGLVEEVKWGAPVYTSDGQNIVGIGAFKSYVGLWFFQGALLADKEKLLINAQEGKTKAMRQWRFSSVTEINGVLIKQYVAEAIKNSKDGHRIKAAEPQPAIIPAELNALFEAESELKLTFSGLPAYKQNEYAEYITEAKRITTKEARLIKIKPMILQGIGLHDKYR